LRSRRVIVAQDYQAAYDLRATCFRDAAAMTGRDAALTRFKLENVAARLPLSPTAQVLDVGPGDGELFRRIAPRVARCLGVDPSKRAVARLRGLFAGFSNVDFTMGGCHRLPVADASFDIVVCNSVLLMMPDRNALLRALRELARVCSPDGMVYAGEIVVRAERGFAGLVRKIGDMGPRGFTRTLTGMYLRPWLRGEPVLLEPVGRGAILAPEEFEALCREAGLSPERLPHPELRRVSRSRLDYRLQRLHSPASS